MPTGKLVIMTDSTCDLPDSLLDRYGVRFVPLRIIYETREYRDRLEITSEKVFAALASEVPRSSMPHPSDVLEILEGLKAEGVTDVVHLSISSGLSGSADLVRMTAQQVDGLRVEVVDTRTVSMGLGFLVLEAAREAERTNDAKAVVAHVERVRARMEAILVIRTLDYLIKGGRIGRVEGTLGSLLDIKPVIAFGQDGVLHSVARARGFKNALKKLLSIVESQFAGKRINLAIVHAAVLQEAGALLEEVRKFATVCESYIVQVCPVLGIYSGPGLLGVVAYEAGQPG